jgi:hypothetical protein
MMCPPRVIMSHKYQEKGEKGKVKCKCCNIAPLSDVQLPQLHLVSTLEHVIIVIVLMHEEFRLVCPHLADVPPEISCWT